MARLVDLSHEIEHGMVTYPGLAPPVVSDWLSRDASRAKYAPGTTFQIGKIEMIANTGTYLDAPFHQLSLDQRRDVEAATHLRIAVVGNNAPPDLGRGDLRKHSGKRRHDLFFLPIREHRVNQCILTRGRLWPCRSHP